MPRIIQDLSLIYPQLIDKGFKAKLDELHLLYKADLFADITMSHFISKRASQLEQELKTIVSEIYIG